MMSAFPTEQALGQTPALPWVQCSSASFAANARKENARSSPMFPSIAVDSGKFPIEMLRQNVTTEAFGKMAGRVSC
jgi:hypothetical protein